MKISIEDQIRAVAVALLDPKVAHGSDYLEFIYSDEDGNPVVGPDGEPGWFNSAIPSNAVDELDPEISCDTVRDVVRVLTVLMALRNSEIVLDDRQAISEIIVKALI